jgi:hypothetical protein
MIRFAARHGVVICHTIAVYYLETLGSASAFAMPSVRAAIGIFPQAETGTFAIADAIY